MQTELFPIDSFIDRDFYYGEPSHHMNERSTKHKKRPIRKAIAPLSKKTIAIPAQTIHTI